MQAWSTALFVLLWSSGAIVSRWGLDQASPFVLLALRFGVALTVLVLLAGRGRGWLPAPGACRSGLVSAQWFSTASSVVMFRAMVMEAWIAG